MYLWLLESQLDGLSKRKNNSTLKARIVSNILLVIIMVVTTRAMVCAQLRINESMGNAWEEQVRKNIFQYVVNFIGNMRWVTKL